MAAPWPCARVLSCPWGRSRRLLYGEGCATPGMPSHEWCRPDLGVPWSVPACHGGRHSEETQHGHFAALPCLLAALRDGLVSRGWDGASCWPLCHHQPQPHRPPCHRRVPKAGGGFGGLTARGSPSRAHTVYPYNGDMALKLGDLATQSQAGGDAGLLFGLPPTPQGRGGPGAGGRLLLPPAVPRSRARGLRALGAHRWLMPSACMKYPICCGTKGALCY